jgi:hypothetical protein
MNPPKRFPRTMLDICQDDDSDILIGVVTNHRAHASIVALFLREHDFTSTSNSELYPIAVHQLPVILHMVEHLGSEEGCRRLRREQAACLHLPLCYTPLHNIRDGIYYLLRTTLKRLLQP